MGRRGRKLKAWPLLLVLAAVYWGREHFGISDVSDVDSLSRAAMPIALILLAVAAVWLVLKLLIFGSGREDDTDD